MTNDVVESFGRKPDIFLRFLSECGNVTQAATACGYKTAQSLYALRRSNKAFRRAWEEAMNQFGDVLEAEAIRRAKDGVLKDVYYKGEVVGQERVFSDGLMGKLIEGAKPEKYKPSANNGPTNVNVKVGIAVLPAKAASVEDWERESIELHKPEVIEGECTPVPQSQPQIENKPVPEMSSIPTIVKV